jgi:hypothetical protein
MQEPLLRGFMPANGTCNFMEFPVATFSIFILQQTYFNGHNAIQVQLDKKGIRYRRHENAFVDVADPEEIKKTAESLHGRDVLNRVNYWMNIFFKFDKGKYSTCSKYLQHEWYLSQVEPAFPE